MSTRHALAAATRIIIAFAILSSLVAEHGLVHNGLNAKHDFVKQSFHSFVDVLAGRSTRLKERHSAAT